MMYEDFVKARHKIGKDLINVVVQFEALGNQTGESLKRMGDMFTVSQLRRIKDMIKAIETGSFK